MHETYITNTNVLNFIVKSKTVQIELLINDNERVSHVLILNRFKGMPLFKKGQQIQVRISRDDFGISITPTFFDSKQRCKKCGRFYKLYCKHCYERFKVFEAEFDKHWGRFLRN